MGFKGMLGRGLAGGAIGAYMGWDNGTSGRIGGAAAGALAGMAGPWAGRKLYGMQNRVGGALRWAGGYANKGMGWAAGKMTKPMNALNMRALRYNPGSFARKAGVKGANLMYGAQGALASNKYGGAAMTALGMGAAGYIGSSILGSNSGY